MKIKPTNKTLPLPKEFQNRVAQLWGKEVRCLVVKVDATTEVVRLWSRQCLREMQGLVGGTLGAVGLPEGLAAFINDNGATQPMNMAITSYLGTQGIRDRVYGDVVIHAADENGELVDLSDDAIEFYQSVAKVIHEIGK